ncbi:MAG: hypothetical protein AABX38_00095 [Candidatus Micrarchaeota archaeon]
MVEPIAKRKPSVADELKFLKAEAVIPKRSARIAVPKKNETQDVSRKEAEKLAASLENEARKIEAKKVKRS